jgi:hypothetical protein
VRSNPLSRPTSLTIAVALVAGAFVACAPAKPATTTLTSAELPAPKEAEPPPPGQLVCRASSIHDGTTELFLEWNGGAAKGTLRRTAPSGMVSQQNVRAERYKGMIVADDTLSTDLVVHAATVREHNGKPHIRLGESKQGWIACE